MDEYGLDNKDLWELTIIVLRILQGFALGLVSLSVLWYLVDLFAIR